MNVGLRRMLDGAILAGALIVPTIYSAVYQEGPIGAMVRTVLEVTGIRYFVVMFR